MPMPVTQYARNGDVNIAYQVVGTGPADLVLALGFSTHVEVQWEFPPYARFIERLASFARVIVFDKRGMGLSDRPSVLSTFEEQLDDLRAVLDAVGAARAALFGWNEGGPMSLLFAATYPERTAALVLLSSYAKATRSEDYPFGATRRSTRPSRPGSSATGAAAHSSHARRRRASPTTRAFDVGSGASNGTR